ncbi:MAG: acyltransferase [Ardenticatenaceae bacterium]|nr:acyltransferase [Anaerolineales bacterium]MCB8922917.1 acyltransferase [Ardenticatenaceae bacterium]MCB8990347.1 acyltransferase [Ardenticatenaceae bacterium]MCB9005240.1 acyltransferase [Ardenticatenaceae bacterium]
MLRRLPSTLLGPLALFLMFVNTFFSVIPLYIVTLFKLIIPVPAWRKFCTQILVRIAENWIAVNNAIFHHTQHTHWDIRGLEDLTKDDWYLVNANHQTWLDIFVLQRVFNRRIPFLKFFTKQELVWFPLLGPAWWALDFPFMKRYSKEKLARHPELRGKDLETTRKMCERFKDDPVAIINFLEGTRLTPAKHEKQQSPYRNLLKPKAGGIAFVLAAMNEKIKTLLNVTIVYPDGFANFWQFLSGKTPRIIIHIEKMTIPAQFLRGDYSNDSAYREQFQAWVRALWEQKDTLIEALTNGAN